MIRVFIADDHAVVRDGLKSLLDGVEDMSSVGSACSAREVLRELTRARWDVLILDMSLPDGGGFEVLRQIRGARPDIAVVVYSMYPEEQYGARALRMGAAAYLAKSRSIDELLVAIRRASSGRRYVTQAIAEQFVGPEPQRPVELSDREQQILQLVVEGKRTSEIARALCISASTVSTHLGRIKQKLGVDSTAALVERALRDGLPR
ncbi:MAG: response regulator transcription factor [Myxococcales bacterium]|nr:response regulator transcription factor [Myxococcales bacterium]